MKQELHETLLTSWWLAHASFLNGWRLRCWTLACFCDFILFKATSAQIWTLTKKTVFANQFLQRQKHSTPSRKVNAVASFYFFIWWQGLGFAERFELVVDLVECEFLFEFVMLLTSLRQLSCFSLQLQQQQPKWFESWKNSTNQRGSYKAVLGVQLLFHVFNFSVEIF